MALEHDPTKGFLHGVRVLQYTDEQGDYTGKLLQGLGADVVMVEPPGGSPSRRIGPFADDDPTAENSLFHWHYNVGKRSVVLDLTTPAGKESFKRLAAASDVLLESMPPGQMADLGLAYDDLKDSAPGLVYASISPFGQTGPWRDYKSSDLVHLALGGEMNYTRYGPRLDGTYDTPPIAGQMWQSFHFAGDYAVHAILAALTHRMDSGRGQQIDVSIHHVMSNSTETDFPSWLYQHLDIAPQTSVAMQASPTREGRYAVATALAGMGWGPTWNDVVGFLREFDMVDDLDDAKYEDPAYRMSPDVQQHLAEVLNRVTAATPMEEIWHAGQRHGLLWAAVRKPEENLTDAHWLARDTFGEVDHPELGRTLTYPVSRWYSPEVPWQAGTRAPRIGEHTDEVIKEAGAARQLLEPVPNRPAPNLKPVAREYPLTGMRMLDLTQLLATAGGTKVLSSFGVECIRVEWKNRLDLRMNQQVTPPPGAPAFSPNRGGYFNDINSGRMGISLNMRTDKGKEIFRELLRTSDLIGEGYRPGTMEKFGLGYEDMKKIRPDIVYVQQPGFGKAGPYQGYGSIGPVANAIAGITDMSGLPEPYMPRGWLYSFMDFGGAYNMAMAMLCGLYYKRLTGKGIYIDSSQIEPGIHYTGTAILDYQVNGRPYSRTGNRSPYLAAAPHGAYPCAGPASSGAAGGQRWLAVSCYTDTQWQALVRLMGDPEWARDPRFATLEARYKNQDALDEQFSGWTRTLDGYELMDSLQGAGIPAGVCQTIQERFDRDPQLAHLGWLTDLPHSEIGTYGIRSFHSSLSLTPGHPGGVTERGAPCYGEDNDYVYGTLLGMSESEIEKLKAEDVI